MIRNRIILCLVIVATGVFVSFFGGSISYGLFYTSLLVPVVSFAYMLYVHFRCRIYQLIEHKTVVKGEHIPYQFILSNEDVIAFTNIYVSFRTDFSEVDHVDADKTYCLLPQERCEQNTSICCHYRGEYLVGAEYVYITDYLNLFRIRFEAPSPITVHVMPRVLRLQQLRIGEEMEGKKSTSRAEIEQNVPDVEIRNYIAGDERRMIHWKSVAREHKLMTRKYTKEPKSEITLYLDLTKKEATLLEQMQIEDKMIELVLAISDYYHRANTPIQCIYESNGFKEQKIMSKSDFDRLYEMCNTVYFRSKILIHHLLEQTTNLTKNTTWGVVITHSLTDELIIACYEKIRLGCIITILLVSSEDYKDKIQKLDARIHFHQIQLQQEITEVI